MSVVGGMEDWLRRRQGEEEAAWSLCAAVGRAKAGGVEHAGRQRGQAYAMNGAFTHTKPLSESTSFASSYYNRPAGELEVVVFFFCFFLLLLWLCVGFLSQKHTPNT